MSTSIDDRAPATGDDDEIGSLRELLLGPEQRRVAALEARLNDSERRADDVAAVLPRVLLEHADDPHLTRALTPPLERAITGSVQRNPQPLADALFPVMGPAIRKAVAAGLAAMVESLNRTLEHALSPRSLRWRLEALRTGRPFAEIVLLKTLLYRVEQVFLIDRKGGLLLQHVRAGGDAIKDADMVSGMLTAIRDFVQDSFRVSDSDSLDALQVGELSVWIEAGPHALVAAVIRGSAPRELRRELQLALETIHLQFGDLLSTFSGDASALDGTRPALEGCLQLQYRAEERTPRTRLAWLFIALAGAALVVWFWLGARADARWQRYLNALRAEPGLVVVSSDRRGGRYVVSGLQDPLARDPASLLASAGLSPDQVVGEWAPYQALDPRLIVIRARELLRPPGGVDLVLNQGVLSATGSPPLPWVAEAQRLAPFIAGVRSFDGAGALAAARDAAVAGLEAESVLFAKGAARPAAGSEDVLSRLVIHLRQLDAVASALGTRIKVEVIGHTDADGPEASNMPLSLSRAETVLRAMATPPPAHLDLSTFGQGSRTPVVVSDVEADKRRNRRVSVRVIR